MNRVRSVSAYMAIFLIILYPEITLAKFYIGAEYSYYSIDIERIEAINTPPNSLMLVADLPPGTPYIDLFPPSSSLAGLFTEVQLMDIYPDNHHGGSAFIGYRFNVPLSLEIGYFRSVTRNGHLNGQRGDILSAESKLSFESIRADLAGYYSIPSINSVELIASIGVIYQQTEASTRYEQSIFCIALVGVTCSPLIGGESTTLKDTRVQFGAGVNYKINKPLSLRAMVRVIPGVLICMLD